MILEAALKSSTDAQAGLSTCRTYENGIKRVGMGYFHSLFYRSCSETWSIVFDMPVRTVICGVLVFILTEAMHYFRTKKIDWQTFGWGASEALAAAIVVLIAIFMLNFFVLTPKHINSDSDQQRLRAVQQADKLKKDLAKKNQGIEIHEIDPQARQRLLETQKELDAANQRIRELDPLQQPIASAEGIATVVVTGTDLEGDTHDILHGGMIAMATDSVGDLYGITIEHDTEGKVNNQKVFTLHVSNYPQCPCLGKPVWSLKSCNEIQIVFSKGVIPDDAIVSGGAVKWVINGNVPLTFDIPPQKPSFQDNWMGNNRVAWIFVLNLSQGLKPLLQAPDREASQPSPAL